MMQKKKKFLLFRIFVHNFFFFSKLSRVRQCFIEKDLESGNYHTFKGTGRRDSLYLNSKKTIFGQGS